MSITSIFFASRATARKEKDVRNGKLIDNGTSAQDGKRWEVQYNDLTQSAAIKEFAIEHSIPCVDVVLTETDPKELTGIPVLDELSAFVETELPDVEEIRDILVLPSTVKRGSDTRKMQMKDYKGNRVNVLVRRSKVASRLAAHMAK